MSVAIRAWVWEARPEEAAVFWDVLSEDERARAGRFFKDIDRQRWIVSRGRTREILGSLVGIEAASIQFGVGAKGRPFLAAQGAPVPSFNLSHSGSVGLLAVCDDLPVGADLEAIRPIEDSEIAWALSRVERDQLANVAPTERLETFFRFWTLKEALMKGTGLGASLPLHDFDIGLAGPAVLRMAGFPGEAKRWAFAEGVPAVGMRAAITARTDGQDIAVSWRRLT